MTLNSHSEIIACETSTDGAVTVLASNGVLPYTFEWSSSASTINTASDLGVGTEYVTVRDACGTEKIDSVVIGFYPALTITTQHISDVNCIGGTDGVAAVTTSGGIQPYTYAWENSVSDVNIANDLSLGIIHVTVSDNCGSVEDSVLINEKPELIISLNKIDETCASSDGKAIVTAQNGSVNYTYEWYDAYPFMGAPISNNDTLEDLSAGSYYVKVIDDCGAKIDSIVVNDSPELIMTLSSHSEILNCETSTNGTVTVLASSGVLPYTFEWSSSASTTYQASDLSVGTEYVTMTDACGTEKIDSVVIGFYPALTITTQHISDVNCVGGTDGVAAVTTSGGIQPYTYQWEGSTSANNIADDLSSGMIHVTVSDNCGSVEDSVMINEMPELTLELFADYETCTGSNTTVSVVATNGYGTFNYEWYDAFPLIGSIISDNDTVEGLTGSYYVKVIDDCGAKIDSIVVNDSPELRMTLSSHSETLNCENSTNGSVTILASSGVLPYTYTWSRSVSLTNMAIDLSVGTEYVTVEDACGTIIIDSIFVSHLPSISYTENINEPLCNKDTNGIIALEVSGGIHPYIINWDNFDNNELIQQNLSAGEYNFTITDLCGETEGAVILNNPDSLYIIGTVTDVSASGSVDGSILAEVYGGVSPYQYYWSNGEIYADLINIPEGNYVIKVADFNNCSVVDSFAIAANIELIETMEAFTPNGDGVNEIWTIKNIDKFPDAEIKIFNQWGNLVFESTGYDEPWDGTSNGKELSSAVYYYIIDLKDESDPKSGAITLLR